MNDFEKQEGGEVLSGFTAIPVVHALINYLPKQQLK
jgi:hypothetical protein